MSLPCVRMRSDKLPRQLGDLLVALRVPEQVLAALGDGDVRVHAAAVDADHWLRQEARRHAHLRRNLPADQLVELNLVRRRNHFAIAVVDLELRRRNLGMVLLVLEAHRALHFSGACR